MLKIDTGIYYPKQLLHKLLHIRRGNCMATWMAHLRVADGVLKQNKQLSKEEYIMGNIAPDSGVPSSDWSTFYPPKAITHFRIADAEGNIALRPEVFADQYLSEKQRKQYSNKQYSFYLGYYHHLLVDVLWHTTILEPAKVTYKKEYETDRMAAIWKWKADWYDLDFLFLEKNPHLEAWETYMQLKEFHNSYLDFFPENAFTDRQAYIVGFYKEKRENLHREYPYLNETQMDEFIQLAVSQNQTIR